MFPSSADAGVIPVTRSRRCARMLSFDVDGTTVKVCLIEDGEPRTSRAFEAGRAERNESLAASANIARP